MLKICLHAPCREHRGVANRESLWTPGQEITISFLGGDSWQQEVVKNHSIEWLKYANLKFRFIHERGAMVRISFVWGSSWSFVGKGYWTEHHTPTMNLGWILPSESIEQIRGTILHEFGHAIGLEHEHQSPNVEIPWNKEAVYRWAEGAPNYWDKSTVDHNIFELLEAERMIATSFDPKSIMLYPVLPELTDGKMDIGWNNELSELDIKLIQEVYPYEHQNA